MDAIVVTLADSFDDWRIKSNAIHEDVVSVNDRLGEDTINVSGAANAIEAINALMAMIGDITQLTTTNKNNLVEAINEVTT